MNMNHPLNRIVLSLILIACTSMSIASGNEAVVEKRFDATSLRLDNIRMKLKINTHADQEIQVKVFTPKSNETPVDMSMSGSELVIEQLKTASIGDVSVITHSTGSGRGRSVVTIGNQTTVIEGNHVHVKQGGYLSQPRMEISVPHGTAISFNHFKGKAEIGDINGTFSMHGSGKVTAGKLKAVELRIGNNAKVEIQQVKERLAVDASGNSKLSMQLGDVEHLQANVSGNSRVSYGGHAHTASLSVTDNGKLFVASVDERRNSSISRNGRLTIGNW